MTGLLLSAAAILIGTVATWWGSSRLEQSSAKLAKHYRLPAVVQGSLVVAVGSSFPELSTTVLSTLIHGEFELGMSTIVGSAIFNILVIPGIAGLVSGRAEHGLALVYRDVQFYLTSVAVLLLTFSFAVIYSPAEDPEHPLVGSLTRPVAAVPLLLYAMYLFLQQQDTAEHRKGSPPSEPSSTSPGRNWLVLLLSLAVILAGVEALVRSVIYLGDYFQTPSFLWGVTLLAAATSLPDALVSYRAARQGNTDVSLGNVLGSNIFDLLVAIPAGVMIAGATSVDYTVAAPLMAMLTLATVVLFAFMRTGFVLGKREAWLLLGLYAFFVTWAVLESIGVLNWVGG